MIKGTKKYFIIGTICILCASAVLANNIYEDYLVGEKTKVITDKILQEENKKTKECNDLSDFQRTMPIKEIHGKKYIGYLEIKKLGLRLPVMNSWSYENIKISPARYGGSVYEKNMIILAHNYKSHFGNLHRIKNEGRIEFYHMSLFKKRSN